ncbi:UbiX family flavin prenyltransferase [Acetonema longum]|uniref:Flavin prenyltransferase UbiX n=1 Tax=Acetonema longum DSM 6540 TaxID=1009370 RepID=F7NHY0_9FIRM|nr:UbiX family flavin prenyltransferase [Acetonema longum]EGO64359.1 3-octaprenyl-4-hydroxybenzoate carboxy-lyase [Acetonema longum DSM 6540]
MKPKRIIVAITGASGAILGIRILEELRRLEVETHLVLSQWAERTIRMETDYTVEQVRSLAGVCHPVDDLAASISSGSFHTDGMVIAPCSMKTLAAIACGFSYNLISRAADVAIKEKRRLVLVPRETPLSSIHLQNMLALSNNGVVLLPPCVGFYTRPDTVEAIVNHLTGKILDVLGFEHQLFPRWTGTPEK